MMLSIISIAFVCSTTLGMISMTSLKAIENTFTSLTYTLPYTWVRFDESWDTPKFDSELVEDKSILFFKNNLDKYINSFTLGFYYFDSKTYEEAKDKYSTGVRLSFKCTYGISKKYQKACIYTIKENKIHYEN